MKFRFDPNLEYQVNAIKSAVRLFEGTERLDTSLSLVMKNGVVGNKLTLTENELLKNLNRVQADDELQNGRPIDTSEELDGMDFSIEMETGTGKTYVYLRTIMELYKEYGLRKFMIIVPSVAIREGVLKTLKITREHFGKLYNNPAYRFYEYDSENLSRIRDFVSSNTLEIMVITLDSFNKDRNIFNRRMDRLSGNKPIELVRATRPILILDEPQNMESETSKEALSNLNPLFKLRYSASHRKYYNLIYRLTPIDAYRLRLVKKIEVASVTEDHDENNAYIECRSVDSKKTVISTKLKVYMRQGPDVKPKIRTFRKGDDLYKETGLEAYKGFVIERLDAQYGEVEFANGITVREDEPALGPDHKTIAKAQIRYTVREHMNKAAELRKEGIKVLSLFFIDQVKNYTDDDGYIRNSFEEVYNELRKRDEPWANHYKDVEPEDVQGSYFSEYKSESYMEQDKEAYDLIMKDKEKLLSFEEPTEFIFSHSALREGWDNPNIFNICTLNRTISTIRKRQEIGRGVRLAVNQEGERIFDEEINRLTVVANETYEEYVSRLQTEYIEELGEGTESPKPENAKKRKTINLKKGFKLNPDFKELWNKISRKTYYDINLDRKALIEKAIEEINKIKVPRIKIRTEKAVVEDIKDSGELDTLLVGSGETEIKRDYELPNVSQRLAEETSLTRRTIRKILVQTNNLEQVFNNPAEYINRVAAAIEKVKRDFLVKGISYIETDDYYKMALFDKIEGYEDSLIPVKRSIYDYVKYDSDVEKDFAQSLDNMDEVKLYIKLPGWFTVPTPIGEYNPDWAIVFQIQDEFGNKKDKLYLVRETKGKDDPEELRVKEQHKIYCAEKHFDTIGVDYDVETDADEFYQKIYRD